MTRVRVHFYPDPLLCLSRHCPYPLPLTELRTPLHGILAFTGLALEEKTLPTHVRESLNEALGGGRMLLGLIDKIFEFVRLSSAVVERSSPRAVAAAAAAAAASAAAAAGAGPASALAWGRPLGGGLMTPRASLEDKVGNRMADSSQATSHHHPSLLPPQLPDAAATLDFLAVASDVLNAVAALSRRNGVVVVLTVDPALQQAHPPLIGDGVAIRQILLQLIEVRRNFLLPTYWCWKEVLQQCCCSPSCGVVTGGY